jgi:hypothetical protein
MPDLSDEQLSSELQRRAALSSGAEDWTRGRLGDVVLDAVRTQPSAVATSRASRWLSLAAVAAALVLLIVALPSLNALPGPGQPSASPSPGGLSVMTTAEFAAQLAAGKLDGQTVLVNGSISAMVDMTRRPFCDGTKVACPIGQLDFAKATIPVVAEDVAVATSQDSTVTVVGDSWQWWTAVEPPIAGVLVLSVDENGQVEYLGRALNGDPATWSVSAVQSSLDLNSRALDEVVLVDAWLTGYEYSGTMSCPMTPAGPLASLPKSDGCGVGSWLADQPVSMDPNNPVAPSPALHVQTDAARTFAAGQQVSTGAGDSFVPERAVFLVSRRLYGDGCMDPSTPCWNWAIVGRLSQPAAEVAPSAVPGPPTPTTEPSVPAGAQQFDCGDNIALVDATGDVVHCGNGSVIDYHTARSGVAAAADPRVIHVTWGNSYCVRSQRLDVSLATVGGLPGYAVTVTPTSFEPLCMDAPEAHTADIEFADPPNVDAVALNAESGIVECTRAGDLGSGIGQVAIRDGTGLIASCIQSSPPGAARVDSIESVQANQLLIRWIDETGPAYVPITFARIADHYEFASGDWCNSCAAGRFQILVEFSVPIDASTVWIGLDGRTPAPAATPTPQLVPSLSPTPTGYSVKIDQGLQPQWNAEAAAQAVFDQIKTNERVYGVVLVPAQILSVEAMMGKDILDAAGGPDTELPIAWVVHARGTFRNDTGPNPSSFHFFAEGWYVFGDDGSLVGLHLTDQQPEPSASAP